MKTSSDGAIACNVEGSTLDGLSVEGVDGAPNLAIVQAGDEWQTLGTRNTADNEPTTSGAIASDGNCLVDIENLVALAAAVDALLGGSRLLPARRLARELHVALLAAQSRRAPALHASRDR